MSKVEFWKGKVSVTLEIDSKLRKLDNLEKKLRENERLQIEPKEVLLFFNGYTLERIFNELPDDVSYVYVNSMAVKVCCTNPEFQQKIEEKGSVMKMNLSEKKNPLDGIREQIYKKINSKMGCCGWLIDQGSLMIACSEVSNPRLFTVTIPEAKKYSISIQGGDRVLTYFNVVGSLRDMETAKRHINQFMLTKCCRDDLQKTILIKKMEVNEDKKEIKLTLEKHIVMVYWNFSSKKDLCIITKLNDKGNTEPLDLLRQFNAIYRLNFAVDVCGHQLDEALESFRLEPMNDRNENGMRATFSWRPGKMRVYQFRFENCASCQSVLFGNITDEETLNDYLRKCAKIHLEENFQYDSEFSLQRHPEEEQLRAVKVKDKSKFKPKKIWLLFFISKSLLNLRRNKRWRLVYDPSQTIGYLKWYVAKKWGLNLDSIIFQQKHVWSQEFDNKTILEVAMGRGRIIVSENCDVVVHDSTSNLENTFHKDTSMSSIKRYYFYKHFDAIKSHGYDFVDLVLHIGDRVIDDNDCLLSEASAGHQRVEITLMEPEGERMLSIRIKVNDDIITHDFPIGSTIKDVRAFMADQYSVKPEAVSLMYVGKTLGDNLIVNRLRLGPTNALVAFIESNDPIFIATCKALQMRKEKWQFIDREDNNSTYTLEFYGEDIIEDVREVVADKIGISKSQLKLWFNDNELSDDTSLCEVGVGTNDFIEIQVQDTDLEEFTNTLRTAIKSKDAVKSAKEEEEDIFEEEDTIDPFEEEAYSRVSIPELIYLRRVMKEQFPELYISELEAIVIFLECGKDMRKWEIKITELC